MIGVTEKDIANQTQNAIAAFHELAAQGNISKLDQMVQKGMNVNAKNQVGGTALGLGISRRNPQVVQFLLDNKANPNIIFSTPGFKFTSIQQAIENLLIAIDEQVKEAEVLDKKIINILVKNGADLRLGLELSEGNGTKRISKYIHGLIF